MLDPLIYFTINLGYGQFIIVTIQNCDTYNLVRYGFVCWIDLVYISCLSKILLVYIIILNQIK